ncbi:Myosin-9 [Desmophyllum pertusum]|uniref:Myosin-9 n=1 Tax=Desmophyllum pertusum TaxID=174260 RepID=A0A9X0A271_9CNID|nr:Myosin-9 [Desmophyllum pertusum]
MTSLTNLTSQRQLPVKIGSFLVSTSTENELKAVVRRKESQIANIVRYSDEKRRKDKTTIRDLRAQLTEREERERACERENENLRWQIEDLKIAQRDQEEGDFGKNVHELEKGKRLLEEQLEEKRQQIEELEDEVQITEDAKLRMEVNMQAAKTQFDRELAARDEQNEEKRKALLKQLRELENELDEERKARVNAVHSKKKIEMDIAEFEEQPEAGNSVKEDGLRQLKKYQEQVKDIQRDLDDARHARDEISERAKNNERKDKQLEANFLQMQEDLAAAERARKSLEAKRDELAGELASSTQIRGSAADENRRLDARITEVEEELKEERTQNELLLEKYKRANMQEAFFCKGEFGKNVHELEKAKRLLEAQLEEKKQQIEELEDEVQITEDAKLRMEVNMQAAKTQIDRELAARDEQNEANTKDLYKQLRELENELDEERKARVNAVHSKKKIEMDIAEFEEQLEAANRVKEDGLRQLKKYQEQVKDIQRDLDDSRHARDVKSERAKDNERKDKQLEASFLQMQENIAGAERARTSLEAERDKLAEELASSTQIRCSAADENRRLDVRITEVEEELKEERTQNEMLLEKYKLANMQGDFGKNVHELEKAKRLLEAQLEEKKQQIEEQVQITEDAKLRMDVNMEAATTQFDRELAARDEQNEANTKDLYKQLRELENELDEERKARVNAVHSKKKIEMDIAEFEEQLEAANSVKEDGLRQLKKCQEQVKDIQRDLDDSRHARDEISERAKDNERKDKQLEANLLQMQEDLAAAERARKSLEAERDELAEELASSTQIRGSAADENRRLDARITEVEEELKEERTQNELLLEKYKLANMQGDFGKNVHELEKAKRLLEAQLEEKKQQIEELEDEVQITEDAKLRMEVNMQAAKTQFDRELAARDEQNEANTKDLYKQKKIEMDIAEFEEPLEAANSVKEDGLRQLKKYQEQVKDNQRDLDDSQHARDEISERAKDNERKDKQLEANFLQMQEDLAAAERARKSLEAERDELAEELASSTHIR